MATHCLNQTSLNLETRVVSVVKDSEFRVTTFAMEVKISRFVTVEIHTPIHESLNGGRTILNDLTHCLRVANIIPSNHRVLDVFFKIIHLQVRHSGNATLSLRSVGFFNRCFANECHFTFTRSGNLKGVTHSGNARTNYQKIEFANHLLKLNSMHPQIYKLFSSCRHCRRTFPSMRAQET